MNTRDGVQQALEECQLGGEVSFTSEFLSDAYGECANPIAIFFMDLPEGFVVRRPNAGMAVTLQRIAIA